MSNPPMKADNHPDAGTLPNFNSLREYMADDVWELLSNQASWLVDAIENIAEAFVYWGPDDRLVLCNSKYPHQFLEPDKVRPGVSFRELVEQNIRTGRVVRFNDIDSVSDNPQAYRDRRLQMHRQGGGTFEVMNYDGRWLQARERRTRDGGTVGIYTDITDIKKAEARERASAQKAEEANRAKSRFLAAASHDLRQPLHAMGILTDALAGRLSEPENVELASNLRTSLSTMQSLFDSLLDMSRLDAGVLKPDVRPMPLQPLLREIEREFRPQAKSRGLELRVRAGACNTESDQAMLGRILRNLVGNAIKYTDFGGVLVAVRNQGDQLALEVWDTGIGVPEELQSQMFNEFHQLDVGPVRRQGLGLGLSIASRLCEMLGHQLTVRSVPGQGSIFRVTVPRYRRALSLPLRAPHLQTSNIQGLRVWVVDDDPDNLRASQLLLQGWGCEVTLAKDISSACDQARQQPCPPQLLLADYHLTGDDTGTQLIQALSEYYQQSFPAVIVTGDTEPEPLHQIRAAGHPVIHKPLKPIKLRALLQRYQS